MALFYQKTVAFLIFTVWQFAYVNQTFAKFSLACKMVKKEGTLHFECFLNDFPLWGDLFVRFFTVNQTQLQGNLLLQEVAIY